MIYQYMIFDDGNGWKTKNNILFTKNKPFCSYENLRFMEKSILIKRNQYRVKVNSLYYF